LEVQGIPSKIKVNHESGVFAAAIPVGRYLKIECLLIEASVFWLAARIQNQKEGQT